MSIYIAHRRRKTSNALLRYVRLIARAVRLYTSSVCNVVAAIGSDLNFSAIFLHRLIALGLRLLSFSFGVAHAPFACQR